MYAQSIDGGQVLVHYEGFDVKYDEWIPVQSPRIKGLPVFAPSPPPPNPSSTVPLSPVAVVAAVDAVDGHPSVQDRPGATLRPDHVAAGSNEQVEVDGWRRFTTDDGRTYFHHAILQKTQVNPCL